MMAKVLVTESYLEDIGDAIREKLETEDTYSPSQMATAIGQIGPGTLISKTITANGTYDALDDNADGYSQAVVNVPNSYSSSDEGKVVSNGGLVAQTAKGITENGIYDTTTNNSVNVNVSGGGGGGGVLVTPAFQGLSYCYVSSDGTTFYSTSDKTQYLNLFEVEANNTYALFVGEVIGSRRRASFFSGKTMADFAPYVNTQPSSPGTVIYSNGIWLAPNRQGTDDSGDGLKGRIIYTPSTDGIIAFGTDNNSVEASAYCVNISASGGGGE